MVFVNQGHQTNETPFPLIYPLLLTTVHAGSTGSCVAISVLHARRTQVLVLVKFGRRMAEMQAKQQMAASYHEYTRIFGC